jgi:hypothetical protein
MLSDLFQKSLSKGKKMAVGGGPLFGGSASRTQVRNFFPNQHFFNSVVDPDPHNFGKLDPDPHQIGKLDPCLDPHQSEKQYPDRQQVKRWKPWRFILEHWRFQIWRKVIRRIRIRIRVKNRIRIRIKGKSRIRIRINVMRIRNI